LNFGGKFMILFKKLKRGTFKIFRFYFNNQEKFNDFLKGLPKEKQENFFELSIFYRNFIKNPPINHEANFMKNSFAMLMTFSLIEALMTEEKHLTFYEFLRKDFQPINNLKDLENKEEEYFNRFGTNRKAKRFFDEYVDNECKELFSYAIAKYPRWLNGKYLENIAEEDRISKNLKLFYDMRSKFVHSAEIPNLEIPIILDNGKDKFTIPYRLADLKILFEHGFLRYFGFLGKFSHPSLVKKITEYKKGVDFIKK